MAAGIFGQGKARVQQLEEELRGLKDELEGLRAESKRLQERAERHDERRREAVAASQQAREQVKQQESRIAQLENELERSRAQTKGPSLPSHRTRARLSNGRLEEVLDRLESLRTGREGALTATVHEKAPKQVQDALGERVHLVEEAAPCLVLADDAGIVSLALRPPLLPKIEPLWSDRFHLEREWFQPSGRYLLVLARSDIFAAGIYEDGEQVSFKGLRPRVGRRHSKGGFSQGRFERIREEQIHDHIKRCREALRELLDEEKRLYLVGQKETIQALAEDTEPVVTKTLDATGAPREALDDAHRAFWTTEIRVI